MISVIGHPRSKQGFTLLEICITLCIMAVVLAAALPNLSGYLHEARLREPARYLSLLARTARLDAIEHQRSYQIIFHPDSISMEPVNPPASSNDPTTISTNPSPSSATVPEPEPEVLPDPLIIPSSTVLLVQAWADKSMHLPANFVWTFQPSGLCEPISVKFVQGKAELQLDFDPLTATVSQEKFYIP